MNNPDEALSLMHLEKEQKNVSKFRRLSQSYVTAAKKFRHKHTSTRKAFFYCVASLHPATPPVFMLSFFLFLLKN